FSRGIGPIWQPREDQLPFSANI
ncbi:uncharacterized protein METZ01_LOCUS155917, partial [marine metagenome]